MTFYAPTTTYNQIILSILYPTYFLPILAIVYFIFIVFSQICRTKYLRIRFCNRGGCSHWSKKIQVREG